MYTQYATNAACVNIRKSRFISIKFIRCQDNGSRRYALLVLSTNDQVKRLTRDQLMAIDRLLVKKILENVFINDLIREMDENPSPTIWT